MNRTLSLSLWITSVLLAAMSAPAVASRTEFALIAPVESDTLEFHDELVRVQFVFVQEDGDYRRIGFVLANLSLEAIVVDWDTCSITSSSGGAGNVAHEGTRFMNVGERTPPTTVPPGSKLMDAVIPTASIRYSSSGGWSVSGMDLYDGAELGFYLSLVVRGEPRGYDFRFGVRKAPNLNPVARFAVNGESGGDAVHVAAPGALPGFFTAQVELDAIRSTDVDGSIQRYSWDFGDGTTESASFSFAYHTYDGLGPYDVKLVVTDNEGGTGSATRTVYLYRVTQPQATQLSGNALLSLLVQVLILGLACVVALAAL